MKPTALQLAQDSVNYWGLRVARAEMMKELRGNSSVNTKAYYKARRGVDYSTERYNSAIARRDALVCKPRRKKP